MEQQRAGSASPSVMLLGGARLSGQHEVRLSGHAAVLLARLLLYPDRNVFGQDIADALWEGDFPASWQSIVRIEASKLRRELKAAFGDQATLESGRLGYRVVLPPEVRVDVWEIEALLEQAERAAEAGRHAEARLLAREAEQRLEQPLLAGVERQWVLNERDRLRRQRRLALLRQADSAEALGELDLAIAALERLETLDPFCETTCRRLMRCLIAQDNRAGALAAYARLRRRLRDQLGVAPSAETEQLYLAALGSGEARRADHDHMPTAPANALIGRDAEQAVLAGAWQTACSGGTVVVIVRGEPGSGKSALLEHAAAAPPTAGCAALFGRFGTLGSELAPLADAARLEGPPCPVPGTPEPELSALIGRPLDQGPPLEERVARLLDAWRRLATVHPTLVVLDDVDLASRQAERALELILHAEPIAGLALVLSMGGGGGSAMPGTPSIGPRTAEAWAGLAGERPVRFVELGGLAPFAIEELAERAGFRPSPALVAELAERSGGNPGLLLGLLGRDEAAPSNGQGLRIMELLAARLARLDARHRQALWLAAAQGDAFDPAAVAGSGQVDPDVLESALAHAERLGLVVWTLGGRKAALAHPSLRVLLRTEGAPTWLRPIESCSAPRSSLQPPSDLAPDRAWHHWLELARAAAARGQHAQAAEHAARAVTVLEHAGRAKSDACLAALLAWGSNLARSGDPRHRSVLLDAAELALALDDTLQAATALLERSALLVPTSVARPDERFAALLREVLRRRLPRETRARLLGTLAGELVWDRPLGERQALVRRAERLAKAEGDPRLAAEVAVAAHLATAWPGNVATRRRAARQLLTSARQEGDPALEVRARLFLADAAVECFQLGPAATELAAAEILAARLGQHYPWEVAVRRAGLALLSAPLDVAESASQRAFDVGRPSGAPEEGVLAVFGAQLALIRFEQGRLEELARVLDALENGRPSWGVWQVARCFALAELGHHDEARAVLSELAADGFAGLVPNIAQLGCLTMLGLVAAELGDQEHCQLLAPRLLPWRHRLSWGLAVSAGPVGLALGCLLARLDKRAQARRSLALAAARCEKAGAHRWAARAETALARLDN